MNRKIWIVIGIAAVLLSAGIYFDLNYCS